MLEPTLRKIIVLVDEMHPQRWLICSVNTFECLEGMVGKEYVCICIFEILVQYTGAQLTGHHTWAAYVGTGVCSIIVVCRLTVLKVSIEEQTNTQHR